MKRKNILLCANIIAVLFLLLLSPVFAQNSYVIKLDSLESIIVDEKDNFLDVDSAWTFEAWINVSSYAPGNRDYYIMDRRRAFSFYLIDKGNVGDYAIRFSARDNPADTIFTASLSSDSSGDNETPMFFGTWYHVAATFDGDIARLYINSTETDADTDTDWNLNASYQNITIGGRYTFSWTWAGQVDGTYIDEIRMSDIARAIGDMQTETTHLPYSVDTNTIFLMHLDDKAIPPTYDEGVGFNGGVSSTGGFDSTNYEFHSGLSLPVELASFSAQVKEGKVTLNWKTETEVDNYGFDTERKTKKERRETWEVIGFVEGHGNSNSPKFYSFIDKDLAAGEYSYRLKQIDTDGDFSYSNELSITIGKPMEFVLEQNYPNPFNPFTTIEFSLSQTSHVILEVFDTLGERVGVLASEELSAGTYNYKWDASNLTSGIYLYILQAGDFIQTGKMILLK